MSHERSDLRAYVDLLGGDDHLCARLGVARKTLLYCYDKRRFTAAWYGPFCELADERNVARPPVGMFGWQELRPAEDGRDDKAAAAGAKAQPDPESGPARDSADPEERAA